MRSNLSRLVALMAALVALGVMAGTASAQTVGVCAFIGHADVRANAVQWVGGGGNWGFNSSQAVCAGEQNGNAGAETADIAAGTAAKGGTGVGTYQSLVCGTSQPLSGDARGDAELTGHPLVGANISGSGTVDIPFVAGLGVIQGSFTAAGDAASGRIVGVTAILPNGANGTPLPLFGGLGNTSDPPPPIGSTSGTCVSQYAVAGAFAVENLV